MNGVNRLKHQRMEELLSSKSMNQKCDILSSKTLGIALPQVVCSHSKLYWSCLNKGGQGANAV